MSHFRLIFNLHFFLLEKVIPYWYHKCWQHTKCENNSEIFEKHKMRIMCIQAWKYKIMNNYLEKPFLFLWLGLTIRFSPIICHIYFSNILFCYHFNFIKVVTWVIHKIFNTLYFNYSLIQWYIDNHWSSPPFLISIFSAYSHHVKISLTYVDLFLNI